jgi:hypothetical protein
MSSNNITPAADPLERTYEPPRDLKKHFEAIVGREIALEEAGYVTLRDFVASYTKHKGSYTSREIGTSGNSTKGCGIADLLDVSGLARTGQDGAAEFLLSDFVCQVCRRNDALRFEFPVNLVATPRSRSAVFLTTLASPTADRSDVKIRATSWNADGSPASNTAFDWRCRVPYHCSAVID